MTWLLSLALLTAPGVPGPKDCAITARFGSYAMGIDGRAAAAIEQRIDGHPGVAGKSRHPWGREGEYTLCVRMKPGANPARLFDQLKRLVPEKPRGPIELRLAGRATHARPRR